MTIENILDSLGTLPQDMDLAYLAAEDFMRRHPDLAKDDPLYERSISARTVIAYHERLAAAASKLDALQWQPITSDHLPKVGDEVWGPERQVCSVRDDILLLLSDKAKGWLTSGYTHFRLINPPEEAE